MAGPLTASVEDYTETLAACRETRIASGSSRESAEAERWHGYVNDVRLVSLFLDIQLNRLTTELRSSFQPTRASEICVEHYRAYGDLSGAFVGIGEDEAGKSPAAGEWPVSSVEEHMTDAELGFSLLIDWAVKRQSGHDDLPITMPHG